MRELLTRKELAGATADMIMDRVFTYTPSDDYCVIYDVYEDHLEPADEVGDWKRKLYDNSDEVSHEVIKNMFQSMDAGVPKLSYEIKVKKSEDNPEKIWIHCHLKYHAEKGFYICIANYMRGRTAENLKLFEEARKDPLTKLINKSYSVQMIIDAIEKTGKGTLFIVDIDNFKSVNDTMGHLFGDEVIVSVANGIKSVFRAEDVVGRIGGDEFIVYLDGLTEKSVIRKKAEALCDTVCNIYTGENEQVKISASVGIAILPDDADDYSDLFKKADHALYYTKNKGKNGFSFYDKNNEEMQKNHRIVAKKKEVRNEAEEINEAMDSFYFELNELAFRMLEETRDTMSAVNLMLHKIQDKFGFSSIRIFEPDGNERTLVCKYELCVPGVHSVQGDVCHYTESEWIRLRSRCGSDPYVYKRSEMGKEEGGIFKSRDNVKSGVVLSASCNNFFTGLITFADCFRERGFTKKELKVLKSFERVFSVYKAQENSQANTDYHLKQMAERDSLTGLYKYTVFIKKLEEMIYSIDSASKILYAHMDIAHFKYINETYGYDMGDKVLKNFADQICGADHQLLFAGRIHGDNVIAVYQYPASEMDEMLVEMMNQRLEKYNTVLQSMVNSKNFYINCGVCITDGNDHNYERGITNANYADKLAKENNDTSCVWFDDKMFAEQRNRMQILDEFGDALHLNEFKVFYQPQIDSVSKTIIGVEALSRWVQEDGTMLMPEEYIDILEDIGKLVELDYYMIHKVLAFIGHQLKKGEKIVPVSVNLSKKHINQKDFSEHVQKLLEKYQVPPEYLLFEIKENVFIEYFEKAVEFCESLNEIGIGVMMDSFGQGNSSLNVLDRIPVEYIKLDKVFIKDGVFAKNQEVILGGIVDIAKKLKKSVISVGVETYEQNVSLSKCGCDVIQGNFHSKPLSEKQLKEYIANHSTPENYTAYFSFDGTFECDNSDYTANANGAFIGFDSDILPGRSVLNLPGGFAGHELIELSLGKLLVKDFTVSMWFYEREVNLWSSLFYADFENCFVSIMPKAWNSLSLLRVMDKSDDAGFYDAVSTEKKLDGWVHIAAVYNSVTNSSAIFINGILTGYRADVVAPENPGRVTIGGDIFQPSFNGYVADLKITNKVMSAKEIKNEYEENKGKFLKN